MTPPPRSRPRGVSVSVRPGRPSPAYRLDQPETHEPGKRLLVHGRPDTVERQRIVQPEPQHQPLPRPDHVVELLHLPGRWGARRERRDVAREAGRVPPADTIDCRNRAEPDAEVVPSEPVAEVVPGAQIPSAGAIRREAEVRRLVPAVAGIRERLDHPLEVGLHRLGLTRELGAVRMREARAGLGLELVAGEVLGAERKRLAQVAIEVGGALAGDPVQQVERDVVKVGITKMVEGATDGIRTGAALQHLEQRGLEALRSERYAGDAASAQQVRELGSHCLRVRLDGHLLRRRKAREQPLELRSRR